MKAQVWLSILKLGTLPLDPEHSYQPARRITGSQIWLITEQRAEMWTLPFECSHPASDKCDPVDVMLPWRQTGYTSCGKERANQCTEKQILSQHFPELKKMAEFFCFREMFLYNEEKGYLHRRVYGGGGAGNKSSSPLSS